MVMAALRMNLEKDDELYYATLNSALSKLRAKLMTDRHCSTSPNRSVGPVKVMWYIFC